MENIYERNFFGNLVVKAFCKSIYICRSYDQKSSVYKLFFDSRFRTMRVQNYAGRGIKRGNCAENAPRTDKRCEFINISNDTGRRAGPSAIAELLVQIRSNAM